MGASPPGTGKSPDMGKSRPRHGYWVRFEHRNDSSRALAGSPAANKRSAVKGCYSWVIPNPIADFGYERLNVWRCERGNAHPSHVHTPTTYPELVPARARDGFGVPLCKERSKRGVFLAQSGSPHCAHRTRELCTLSECYNVYSRDRSRLTLLNNEWRRI